MPRKLPFKTFLKSFDLTPRAAISLLVKDKRGNILLAKRLQPPFVNYWHLPGSFILKGEDIESCIKRAAKEELGIELKNNKTELLGIFDDIDKDPRGHILDIIYGFTLDRKFDLKPIGYTKEIKFFKKLPKNIGFNHKETLSKLGYK